MVKFSPILEDSSPKGFFFERIKKRIDEQKWCVRAKTIVFSSYLSHSLKEDRIHFKRHCCWPKFRWGGNHTPMSQKKCSVNSTMVHFSEYFLGGWGGVREKGPESTLRHWEYLFCCIFQGSHASLKHSMYGCLPCLSLGKRRERECKKKKKKSSGW